jgi:hypothetical protein
MEAIKGGSQYKVHGKTHYQRNKQDYIDKAVQRRDEIKTFLKGVKEESGCADCGIKDYRVLDFDHIGKKTIVPSDIPEQGWSAERIMKELEQCEVRCANCHRIVTWERRQASLV